MSKYKLLCGDNMELLQTLPSNSVDSVVTDPPYGLSFMSKKWDYDVPSVEFWKQVYRVLKPGGHILAFGGTRTYHRLVVNIEDAGFEIRDQIQWLYGSGFPKSLNVGKAIDKINGESDREIRFVEWFRTTGLKQKETNQIIGKSDVGSHYLRLDQPAIPTKDLWLKLRPHIKIDIPLWVDELVERVEREREFVGLEITNKTIMRNIGDINESGEYVRTKGQTEWEGWGSALKPANEPICLARKPLSEKSIAENVLKWRTGGLNINGCRVGNEITKTTINNGPGSNGIYGKYKGIDKPNFNDGRFPANLILDETAAEMLDEQSGITKSTKRSSNNNKNTEYTNTYTPQKAEYRDDNTYGDSGGTSRFFYQAKVSKLERNLGLESFEEKKKEYETTTRTNKETADKFGCERKGTAKNTHPTIKPINLMTYLCRLITPPNGIVLDPFMGSGSTGIAALLEGFKFCGMEMDKEYFKISEARISNYEEYRKIIKK